MAQIKTLKELLDEATRIGREIRNVQLACGYDDCDDLSRLDIPKQDPDGLFLWDELRVVMDRLADAQAMVEYLKSPVKAEGILRMGKNDRYRLNGMELPCGIPIEILIQEDDCRDVPYWCRGRLEHNGAFTGSGYYFTGAKSMPLQGARARIR